MPDSPGLFQKMPVEIKLESEIALLRAALAEAERERDTARAEDAEANLAEARQALKRTLYHLAKLVNCGDEDQEGNQIPGVREAAIAQVRETRAFLERTAPPGR